MACCVAAIAPTLSAVLALLDFREISARVLVLGGRWKSERATYRLIEPVALVATADRMSLSGRGKPWSKVSVFSWWHASPNGKHVEGDQEALRLSVFGR